MVRREWALRGEILHTSTSSLTLTHSQPYNLNKPPPGKVRTSYLSQNTIKNKKYCNIKMLYILKLVKVYYVEIAKLCFLYCIISI